VFLDTREWEEKTVLVVTGRNLLADIMSGMTAPEATMWCLYTNVVTWVWNTGLTDLVEAGWTGYLRVGYPLAAWLNLGLDASHDWVVQGNSVATYENLTGSSQTAQGFFVVGARTGYLYGGAPFSPPIVIAPSGLVSLYPQMFANAIPPS
jgi:hypothetical protein